MFTGIVEEVGRVTSCRRRGDGIRFEIAARRVLEDLGVDNSIAVNGTCLTVVRRHRRSFEVDAVRETLRKTNLGLLRPGSSVNLERSVALNQRLGGHLVQGHVDTTGKILRRRDLQNSWMFAVSYPPRYGRYLIPVGSICVDGVSLTVARLHQRSFEVAIIPYTMEHTTFAEYQKDSRVNLEFDILGKYLESLLMGTGSLRRRGRRR